MVHRSSGKNGKNKQPLPESAESSGAAQKPSALTDAQSEVLMFIRSRCQSTGISPSYREIQEHFGYKAIGTVQDHLKALIKKGALEKPENGATARRSARGLIPRGQKLEGVKRLAIYGEVAAGSARQAEQLPLGSLFVSENFASDPCFALRVAGDSMVNAGIYEGDYVIVERTQTIREGDIIVALLDGETTVKRYSCKHGRIYLIPENSRLKPIPVTSENFQIQGKVVGLQRKL